MDTARHIVATLIHRKRRAQARLTRAQQNLTPEPILQHLHTAANEAHNAAEVARRILYHGVESV